MGQPRHLQERGVLSTDLTPAERRRQATLAGHQSDPDAARRLLADHDPAVRSTALAALGRLGAVTPEEITIAAADRDPAVRRRACEVAVATHLGHANIESLLADNDPSVVEMAAWAAGELEIATSVPRLASIATSHSDALAREAAVAALGAIGDPAALPAILTATTDKPAVRRRAVLALAPFSGPEVDAALERAATDRDWQVRDAAELLLRPD